MFDEARQQLGQALKLPPWEEKNRKSIEAGLPEIDRSATGRQVGGRRRIGVGTTGLKSTVGTTRYGGSLERTDAGQLY